MAKFGGLERISVLESAIFERLVVGSFVNNASRIMHMLGVGQLIRRLVSSWINVDPVAWISY